MWRGCDARWQSMPNYFIFSRHQCRLMHAFSSMLLNQSVFMIGIWLNAKWLFSTLFWHIDRQLFIFSEKEASCARMPAGRLVHAFSFHINACVLLRRDKTLKMTQGKTKRNVEIWRVEAMPCHNGHHWFNMYLKQMHAFSVILNDFYERTIKTW